MTVDPAAFSTRAHVDRLHADLRPVLAFTATTHAEWERWRHDLTNRLSDLLGGFPAERCPLDVRVVERVDLEHYRREKIVFTSEPGVDMPAYLLVPHGVSADSPGRAVLCLHGHGRGKDDVVGLAPNLKDLQHYVRSLNYNYAHQFALRGYVVLAPDGRQFGERLADGMSCTWAFTAGHLLGKVLVGLRVWDAMRGFDYLQTRADVQAERVACAGLSCGGTHTLYTAALDQRVRVAVISGYVDSFKDNLIDAGCCPCQYVPNLLRYAECTDIVSLIAPRPLPIENGLDAPLTTRRSGRRLPQCRARLRSARRQRPPGAGPTPGGGHTAGAGNWPTTGSIAGSSLPGRPLRAAPPAQSAG